MLDRSLNSVLDDIERKNPLKMPPVEVYRFAEPDSNTNIVFEGMTIKVTKNSIQKMTNFQQIIILKVFLFCFFRVLLY